MTRHPEDGGPHIEMPAHMDTGWASGYGQPYPDGPIHLDICAALLEMDGHLSHLEMAVNLQMAQMAGHLSHLEMCGASLDGSDARPSGDG